MTKIKIRIAFDIEVEPDTFVIEPMSAPITATVMNGSEHRNVSGRITGFQIMKTFLYREHRGSLAESMTTVREVTKLSDIEGAHSCVYYCFDHRIDWKTWLILDADCRPLGMANGELEE